MKEDDQEQHSAEEIHAELQNGSLPEYDLEDSSFLLPTKIDRRGLSRMINDLLGLQTPVAFDILFNDEPLRTTLAEKLEEQKIQSESTVKLVYTLAITEPEETEVDNVNDWIAGIAFTQHAGYFATACYDGNITLYNATNIVKVMDFVTANRSASAIALHSASDMENNIELVCGHMNGLLEVYCINTSAKKPTRALIATSQSDTDTIEAIAIHMKGSFLAAAGNGNDIFVYDNLYTLLRSHDSDHVEPLLTLSRHKKTVMCIKFLQLAEPILVSASIDWHIAIWDVAKGTLLSIYNCGKSLTCLDVSEDCSELFTGHEEGTIGVWELRCKGDGAQPKAADDFSNCTLTPRVSASMFERSVMAVKVNPKNTNLLSAISLDGCSVLIDKRFVKIPLQSVTFKHQDDPDRGTACCWVSAHEIVCTTASGSVRKLQFKELTSLE
ncbi:WD domain, G-beta repeat containing protein [Babesia divergens]|uniref:WD domain, G-beta repeat containing protein n=1 Tax=Babesia divergens TaxID=32595 RepID=A0AAD9LEP2_BABDI|nr:WD domain, G-beta repeat containing protein [Babesia divergens]